MRHFFWLTHLLLFCSGLILAQENQTDSSQPLAATLTIHDSLFSRFTCTVDQNNDVAIRWNTVGVEEGGYFIVERSYDSNNFETAGVLKITGSASEYDLTDRPPLNGSTFYRIKYNSKEGEPIYSKLQQVNLSASVDFKFYPNPVDKLLIIQTGHLVQIQVMDGMGAIRLSKELRPGIQIVNVSSLEKGNYIIKVMDQQSNKAVSEQLLKN